MRRFQLVFQLFLFLIAAIFLLACERERPQLGDQLLEPSEKLRIRQATSGSMLVSNDTIGYPPIPLFTSAPLGHISDPTFGEVVAHFAMSLAPVAPVAEGFGDGVVIDSAFIDIPCLKSHGDSPLDIDIRVLADTISRLQGKIDDEKYGTGKKIASVALKADQKHIRVALDPQYAHELLTTLHPLRKKGRELMVRFPGLHISSRKREGAGGRILTFKLGAYQSGISIYWRDGSKRGAFLLAPQQSSRRYFVLRMDSRNSLLGEHLLSPRDKQEQQPQFYLAGQGRALAIVNLKPFLAQWKDSVPISLLRAQLNIPIIQAEASVPDTLVRRINAFIKNGNEYRRIPDMVYERGTLFHGYYNREQKQYILNITRFLQRALAGDVPGDALYLFSDESAVGLGRVVLASPTHPETPMHLTLTYTKL